MSTEEMISEKRGDRDVSPLSDVSNRSPNVESSEIVGESTDSSPTQPIQPPPSLTSTLLRIFLMCIVFRTITKPLLNSRYAADRRDMKDLEMELMEQNLKPIPPDEVKVSKIKEILRVQSSAIPQFPEYDALGRRIGLHRCLFRPKEKMDLYVYISEKSNSSFSEIEDKMIWEEHNLSFDWDPNNERTKSITINTYPELLRNESIYAHIYLTKSGSDLSPKSREYNRNHIAKISHQLNVYRPVSKSKKRNLLSQDASLASEESDHTTIGNFWKPTLNIQLVDMWADFTRNHIPPQFAGFIRFDERTGNYFPIIYVNEFWLQSKQYVQINDTVDSLTLDMSYGPIGLLKWQLMSQLEQQWKTQQSLGLQREEESDSFVEMLSQTSPWLLGITLVVTLLHTLFDFLAFKNDVSFWKNTKTLEGLSIRSLVVNCVFQTIITLYLFDNETSYMILISCSIGLIIEYWKLKKAVKMEVIWIEGKKYPKIQFTPAKTYDESDTKIFDRIATNHMSYIVFPLVVGYAIFSLIYKEHKGWYSWLLNSLSGFVYMFGFINMTPQLYINYKLKSVAHLPWRSMVYKSLNTFIDDLFSFIVKMPLLHRLACFRDDIIFFFYLYQRWIYRTDYTRANEYGQVMIQPIESENVNNEKSSELEVEDKKHVKEE